MAEHGEVQYSTAEGNDYPAHEATYKGFLHFVFVGLALVVNILLGLTVGGVIDHWLIAGAMLIFAFICAAIDLAANSRTFSAVALAVSFLAFAFLAVS